MSEPNTAPVVPHVEIRPGWRHEDPELERDVVAFWRRLGILPPDVVPEARAKELCCLTYLDGQVAAVSTATLEVLPFLKARFAMMRIAVDPAHRRRHLGESILLSSRGLLERWSLATPQENVKGVAAVVQAANIEELKRLPVWPKTGLNLVGYTVDGQQIRVSWFEHARLEF
jgi:hypothetical protein